MLTGAFLPAPGQAASSAALGQMLSSLSSLPPLVVGGYGAAAAGGPSSDLPPLSEVQGTTAPAGTTQPLPEGDASAPADAGAGASAVAPGASQGAKWFGCPAQGTGVASYALWPGL